MWLSNALLIFKLEQNAFISTNDSVAEHSYDRGPLPEPFIMMYSVRHDLLTHSLKMMFYSQYVFNGMSHI